MTKCRKTRSTRIEGTAMTRRNDDSSAAEIAPAQPSPGSALISPGFAGLEAELADPARAKIVVLPVPYDLTSTYQKGADRGPAAIIEASAEVELYDIETATEVYRHGIATLQPIVTQGPPEELAELVEHAVAQVLAGGQLPVLLGGEHSVSCGAFRAATEHHPDCTILQLDAHGDTRDTYEGSAYNHACVMARARELAPTVQVGIRAIDASEAAGLDRRRVVFAHEMQDGDDWIDRVIDGLGQEVYLTFDLDAFDSSLMPATGTPEPGGLGWWQAMRLLRRVTTERNVIGFDVVELRPLAGNAAPDFLAAKLVYQLLSYIFAARAAV